MSIQALNWVLEESKARGHARLVMISLANHHNKGTGQCNPGHRTIAQEAGISVGSVSAQIKKLVQLDEIDVLDPGTSHRPAFYRLRFDQQVIEGGEPLRSDSDPLRSNLPASTSNSGESTISPGLDRTIEPSDEPLEPKDMSTSLTLVDVPAQDLVTVIFDAWREATGRTTRTLLDDSRTRVIRKALGLYPFEDCLDAVRGIALSAYHMGANPEGKRYAELDNCLGGKQPAARIEKFRDLYRNDGQLSPLEKARNHKTGGAIVAALERMEREQESGGRALRPAGGAVPVARR